MECRTKAILLARWLGNMSHKLTTPHCDQNATMSVRAPDDSEHQSDRLTSQIAILLQIYRIWNSSKCRMSWSLIPLPSPTKKSIIFMDTDTYTSWNPLPFTLATFSRISAHFNATGVLLCAHHEDVISRRMSLTLQDIAVQSKCNLLNIICLIPRILQYLKYYHWPWVTDESATSSVSRHNHII